MDIKSPNGTGSYRLKVANFGPVSNAELELRPLTVFAGSSNAGKSCIAKLVYVLHACFARHTVARTRSDRLSDFNRAVRRMGDPPGVARRLEEFVLNPAEECVDSSALGKEVATLTRLALEVPDVGPDTSGPLLDVFGTASMDDLILRGARDCRFTLSYEPAGAAGSSEAFQYVFEIAGDKLDCVAVIPPDATLWLNKGRMFRRTGQGAGLGFRPAGDDDEFSVSHAGLLLTLLSLVQPVAAAVFEANGQEGLALSDRDVHIVIGGCVQRPARRGQPTRRTASSGVAHRLPKCFSDPTCAVSKGAFHDPLSLGGPASGGVGMGAQRRLCAENTHFMVDWALSPFLETTYGQRTVAPRFLGDMMPGITYLTLDT